MSTNPPPEPGGGSRKLRWLLGTAVGLGLLTGGFFFFQYRIVDIQLKPLIENELSQAVHSPELIGVRKGRTDRECGIDECFLKGSWESLGKSFDR